MSNLALKGNVVEKRNVLNEMRAVGWSLQELRFFALYLSKINARDPESRYFRMPLYEFVQEMDICRYDVRNIRPVRDSLLQKIVVIPTPKGEEAFQLFKKCKIEKEDDGEWHIEFDAHDDALPLMFEFKEHYVTYKVINVLRLKGENHIRMYEILKQYEGLGEVTLTLEELRKRLGIKSGEYPRWERFKSKVLEECRKALEEHTDIKYTFEAVKKGKGKTSPVKAVIFTITQNNKAEQLSLLEDYEEIRPRTKAKPVDQYSDLGLALLAKVLDYKFDDSQMKLIERELKKSLYAPRNITEQCDFLRDVYLQLNYRRNQKESTGDPIKTEFSYLLGIIKNKLEDKKDELHENN
jgi:hypothetical protein